MHVTKEAVISSRIEGTQTKIDEALLDKEEISPESQNWIGGSSPADAVFVPPHHQYVNELMGDLENFLHNEEFNLPALIQIAIAHYQFETIHPFLDGNGRIGRLLMTLFLVEQGILSKPLLYLSAYFEKSKGLYYDNLTFVRTRNDMAQWIKYFLAGVAETAEKATNTLSKVLELRAVVESHIFITFGRKSQSAGLLLQALLKKPVINVLQAKKITGLSYKAANNLISDFLQSGILKEMTGQSRNRVFVFHQFMKKGSCAAYFDIFFQLIRIAGWCYYIKMLKV